MNNTTAIRLFIVLLFIVAIASAIPFIVIIAALFVVRMDYKKKKKRVKAIKTKQ